MNLRIEAVSYSRVNSEMEVGRRRSLPLDQVMEEEEEGGRVEEEGEKREETGWRWQK